MQNTHTHRHRYTHLEQILLCISLYLSVCLCVQVGQRSTSIGSSRRFEYVHLLSGNVLSLWSMIEAAARAQQADHTTTSSSTDDNAAARLRVVRAHHVSGHSGQPSTATVLGVRLESEMQVGVIRMALQAVGSTNRPQNNSGQVGHGRDTFHPSIHPSLSLCVCV